MQGRGRRQADPGVEACRQMKRAGKWVARKSAGVQGRVGDDADADADESDASRHVGQRAAAEGRRKGETRAVPRGKVVRPQHGLENDKRGGDDKQGPRRHLACVMHVSWMA